LSDASISATAHGGSWRQFGKELVSRTIAPASNVSFVFAMILGPVLFGGLGIWVEIVKLLRSHDPLGYESLITAVATFIPALGCSTALQLVLASTGKDKALVSFAMLMAFVFFLVSILLQIFSTEYTRAFLWVGSFWSAGAVWLWWITNGSDPTYIDKPDAATGGAISRPLTGNLNGFEV
jgi:preprotein translocase subunit SecG